MMQGYRPGSFQARNGDEDKYRAWLVLTTLGINIPMIKFLPTQEQLSFQLGNRWCYHVLVIRVQYQV